MNKKTKNKIKNAFTGSYPDVYIENYDDDHKTLWLVAMGLHETVKIDGKKLITFRELLDG